MRLRVLLISLSMFLPINLSSQIIVWSTIPEYDELKPYSEGIYYCKKDSKWGLLSDKGKVILFPKYDYITSMVDGYAIAGVKDGAKNRINCIIDESYNSIELNDTYYLVNTYYSYFSEEKLPVSNKSGKQGFINTNGELVVKCQFDNVHPFSNGFASVSKSPYAFYIKEKYDSSPRNNTLPVEFNNGDITFASSFFNETAIVAYNEKSAVINTKGQKIRNYKGKINSSCYNKFDYTILNCGSKNRVIEYLSQIDSSIISYQENNLYGYKQDSSIIAYPSFSTASSFLSSGYAIASINGKYGLLHIMNGTISTYLVKQNSTTKLDGSLSDSGKEGIEKCDYVVEVPTTLNQSDLRLLLDNGNGHFQEYVLDNNKSSLRTSFNPAGINNKPKDITIASEIYHKGILLYKYHQSFNISYHQEHKTKIVYPKNLIVIGPTTTTDRANEKDIQVIYATILNPTNTSISVTATLKIPSKKKIVRDSFTISSSQSKILRLPIHNVLVEEIVSATIELSTGKTSTKNVKLKPYY